MITASSAPIRIQDRMAAPAVEPLETGIEPLETGKVNAKLVSLLRPNSLEAGRYHRLRHAVERLAEKNGKSVVIGITSPQSGDGKTLTSINLAGALAQDPNARVLLVELDIRQPRDNIKTYLGIRKLSAPGVTELIQDQTLSLHRAVRYIPSFNLHLLTSGKASENHYELLKSARLAALIQEARERYHYVILDTAPVVPVPDSQLLSPLVDGFMLLVAAGHTSERVLAEALNLLEPDKVMGLVFNAAPVGDTQAY